MEYDSISVYETKLTINNYDIFIKVYPVLQKFQIIRYNFSISRIHDYTCKFNDFFVTYKENNILPYCYFFDIKNEKYDYNGFQLWFNDETNSLCYESAKQVFFFAKFDNLEQYILFTKFVYKYIKGCNERFMK